MATLLDEIIETKRQEVAERQTRVPLEQLKEAISEARDALEISSML